jgi:hypothetical protein
MRVANEAINMGLGGCFSQLIVSSACQNKRMAGGNA